MSIFTSVIKCGICGEPLSGAGNPYTCGCCGNVSYVSNPMLEDELRTANAMRECTRFDEAMLLYKQIVKQYKSDDLSEVYWNLLLCEQRVMFETDEKGERFPSFYAITDDEIEDSLYYMGAIGAAERNAPERVEIFKNLAAKMSRAKQLYARIAESSKPYDLFICFKKSAFEGGDTKDCALAIDLYNHLAKDYNIFFSERSLRDVVVRDFEPNIYYGLYTAKVMLVLCSKKEYVESQWVKNEWSRFHAFAQNPATGKTIIPIFLEDFSPRSLPNELMSYQGLPADYHLFDELSKTLRNILNPIDAEQMLNERLDEQNRKWEEMMAEQRQQEEIRAEEQRHQMEEQRRQMEEQRRQMQEQFDGHSGDRIAPLLKRAVMFLEDGKWKEANQYCEKVLDMDPENAEAWLGKLMVDLQISKRALLATCQESLAANVYYQKALHFGNQALKNELTDYDRQIIERNNEQELKNIWKRQKKAWQDDIAYRRANVKKAKDAWQDAEGEMSYYIGEIRDARRSQKKGKVGAVIHFIALIMLAFVVWRGIPYLVNADFDSIPLFLIAVTALTLALLVFSWVKLHQYRYGWRHIRSLFRPNFLVALLLLDIPFIIWAIQALTGKNGLSDSIQEFSKEIDIRLQTISSIEEEIRSAERRIENRESELRELSGKTFETYKPEYEMWLEAEKRLIAEQKEEKEAEINRAKEMAAEKRREEKKREREEAAKWRAKERALHRLKLCVAIIAVVALLLGCTIFVTNRYELQDGVWYVKKSDGFHLQKALTRDLNEIVIPAELEGAPVVAIEKNAFNRHVALTTITIPDSVTSIGESAFGDCTGLTAITIPDSVTSIGDYAFANCDGLTTITIPDSVTSIGDYAFRICDNLTTITISVSVTGIGEGAFEYCRRLTTVEFGANSQLTSIGDYAFHECSGLTAITIPDSVTSIGRSAFFGCDKLTSVIFENTTGWWYADFSTDTSGKSLASDLLATPTTAARYLTSTCSYYTWKRD